MSKAKPKQTTPRTLEEIADECTRVTAQRERFVSEQPDAAARVAATSEKRNDKLLAAEEGDATAQNAVAELTRELRDAEQRVTDLGELIRQTDRRLAELAAERRQRIAIDVGGDLTVLAQEQLEDAREVDRMVAELKPVLMRMRERVTVSMMQRLTDVSEDEARDITGLIPGSLWHIARRNYEHSLRWTFRDYIDASPSHEALRLNFETSTVALFGRVLPADTTKEKAA